MFCRIPNKYLFIDFKYINLILLNYTEIHYEKPKYLLAKYPKFKFNSKFN